MHTASESHVNDLLQDAWLVYEYAVRAGRLAADADALPNAIEAVELALERGETPHTTALATELARAVAAIAPVSLVDLRESNSPFDSRFRAALKRQRRWLVLLTVALALAIAYFSISLQKVETALAELAQLEDSRIPDKLAALKKLVLEEDAHNYQARDSLQDYFRQLLNELRALQTRRTALLIRIDEVFGETRWPFSPADQGRPENEANMPAPPADQDTQAIDASTLASPAHQGTQELADPCNALDPLRRGVEGIAPDTSTSVNQQLRMLFVLEYCLLDALNLSPETGGYDIHVIKAVTALRSYMALLGAWVLPFLAGLLGASVFMLRETLDPHSRRATLPPAVARIAMGGIAGILIGWFWVAPAQQVIDVSSVPFGLAFLTGFSIDILFTVLDRVRGGLSGAGPSAATAARAGGKTDGRPPAPAARDGVTTAR